MINLNALRKAAKSGDAAIVKSATKEDPGVVNHRFVQLARFRAGAHGCNFIFLSNAINRGSERSRSNRGSALIKAR
jgi:hypothetical protein